MDSEILHQIETIRGYVFVIMVAIVLWVAFKVLESLQRVITGFKKAFNESFVNKVGEYLSAGQYEIAIQESKEQLEKYPNHLNATWFLAKAYFYTDKNEESKEMFKRVIYLEPSWEEDAQAFLEKLNER